MQIYPAVSDHTPSCRHGNIKNVPGFPLCSLSCAGWVLFLIITHLFQAKDVRSIDYNRTDEDAPGHFDEFYENMLENADFMKSVPGFDLPLTAGAGARRSKEFFRLLALQYMHPDKQDRIRILNCTAMNPDMVHIEDAHLEKLWLRC